MEMKKERKSYPKQDLTNQKFGMLTPVEWLRGGKWRCVCDCGNETVVDTRNLKKGHTQSCGCKNRMSKNVKDMSGFENDYLKVLERFGNIGKTASWLCLCKRCGNTFVTRGSNIRFSYTTSCGCVHSKNEEKIKTMLSASNIEFATQYTFPDLVGEGGRRLRFDFAIFKDKQLERLIEYNGLQHYKIPEGSWKSGYETLIKHDLKKKEYCEKNGIKLIVIRYDENYTLKDLLE